MIENIQINISVLEDENRQHSEYMAVNDKRILELKEELKVLEETHKSQIYRYEYSAGGVGLDYRVEAGTLEYRLNGQWTRSDGEFHSILENGVILTKSGKKLYPLLGEQIV